MEREKSDSNIFNIPHSGASDSEISDEDLDLGNPAVPSSDLYDSFEEFIDDPEENISEAKKRPLASSSSESGSTKKDIKQELKKLRKEDRYSQLEKHRDLKITEAQPNKTGSGKPICKPTPSKTQQPSKVPTGRPVLPQSRANQGKANTPQKKTKDSNMSHNTPSASAPGSNDVEEYEVEELNTEKVSINNLCAQPNVLAVFSGLVKKDNIQKLQSFLLSEKKFSDSIKRARLNGKKFIRYSNILINIQTDPKNVTTMDFTKQRFLAACHKQLFEPGLVPDFCSPLVTTVVFNETNPLTKIKPLLGAGFQFSGEVLKAKYGETEAILLFHLGCFVLDYIRMSTAYKHPTTGQLMNPMVNPLHIDFQDYVTSVAARQGDTFIAGCRNIDQASLSVLDSNQDIFCQLVVGVEISKYGGNIKDRVAKTFEAMQAAMKATITRL